MPTYGYECLNCKEQFEVIQKITDEPLKVHEGCGGALRRLLYPVGIVFKGPGFYVNDYAKGRNGASRPPETTGDNGSKSEPKSENKPAAPASTPTPAAAKAD